MDAEPITPCPFPTCGGYAELKSVPVGCVFAYRVRCVACKFQTGDYDIAADAIADWNRLTRLPSIVADSLAEAVEALERLEAGTDVANTACACVGCGCEVERTTDGYEGHDTNCDVAHALDRVEDARHALGLDAKTDTTSPPRSR